MKTIADQYQKNINVVSNFIIDQSQNIEVAIMPNQLAKALLKEYAKRLKSASKEEIVGIHCGRLKDCETLDKAVQTSIEWTQERVLIKHITEENWDLFKVNNTEQKLLPSDYKFNQ
jgi:hypothetical protein